MKVNSLLKRKPPEGVKKYLEKTLHRLYIAKYFGYFRGKYFVEVRCECGVEKLVDISNIVYGTTRSCGCLSDRYNQYRKINKTQKVFND